MTDGGVDMPLTLIILGILIAAFDLATHRSHGLLALLGAMTISSGVLMLIVRGVLQVYA